MQWLIDIVYAKVQELLIDTIAIWSGAIVDIPSGWALCDGGGGRPDLRNKFVIGAGDTFAPDDAGGDINHTHDFTSDGHFHAMELGTGLAAGVVHLDLTDTKTDSGTTGNPSSPPPYYALAYIIKV